MNRSNPHLIIMIRRLLIFVTCWFGALIVASVLVGILGQLFGIGDFKYLTEKIAEGEYSEHILSIKIVFLFQHLLVFSVPPLVFAYIIYRKKLFKYLYLNKGSAALSFLLVLIIAVLSFPTAMIIYELNTMIVPDSWINKGTLNLERRLMEMESMGDLISNLLLFGLVAGIGEELLYRGVIQRLIAKFTQNMHLAVWATGLLFSFMHFQPEGFIPRFLLGTLLGYIFVWSGSLWAAILAHITFNGMQVVLIYFVGVSSMEDPTQGSFSDSINLYTIISLLFFIFGCYALWYINRKKFPEWARKYTSIQIDNKQ